MDGMSLDKCNPAYICHMLQMSCARTINVSSPSEGHNVQLAEVDLLIALLRASVCSSYSWRHISHEGSTAAPRTCMLLCT